MARPRGTGRFRLQILAALGAAGGTLPRPALWDALGRPAPCYLHRRLYAMAADGELTVSAPVQIGRSRVTRIRLTPAGRAALRVRVAELRERVTA